MTSAIPCSTFPFELRNKIVDKLPPQESLKLLKTNSSLRKLVLHNGPFGTWVDSMDFEEWNLDDAPDDAPSDDGLRDDDTPDVELSDDRHPIIFHVTIEKNGYQYQFDILQRSYIPTSIIQKIKACRFLRLNRETRAIDQPLALEYLLESCHRVLPLENLVFVKFLTINQLSPTFLNAIMPSFRFTVAKRAMIDAFPPFNTENTNNLVHFITNNLRFCLEIWIEELFDDLLNALKRTRVERIIVYLGFEETHGDNERHTRVLSNFLTWIERNGLPSVNQDCSLIIKVPVMNPAIIDPFSDHPLLKYEPSSKSITKMFLEMREAERKAFTAFPASPIGRFDLLRCLQKRDCKNNLRFLMMRRKNQSIRHEQGGSSVMFFFVKRLKSVDPTRRLEENCKDVVSLDDSPAAHRQKSVRPAASTSKKRNAADKDPEKEEVMPKKKRRDTDSDSD